MKTALAFLIFISLPVLAFSPVAQASETSSPRVPTVVIAVEVSHENCWQDYLRRLKECEDSFCPNIFSCNDTLLAACIRGARELLNDCRNQP